MNNYSYVCFYYTTTRLFVNTYSTPPPHIIIRQQFFQDHAMPKKRSLYALLLVILSSAFFIGLQRLDNSRNADKRFEAFTDSLFRQEVSSNSITLHYTLSHPESYGIHRAEVSLGSFPTSNTGQLASVENCLSVLDDIPYTSLSEKNKTTYLVLKDSLELTLEGAPYTLYQEPLAPLTGIQAQLPVLLSEYTFYDKSDIQTYLDLLEEIPDYFDSLISFEKAKSDAGLFLPSYIADTLIDECTAFINLGNDNYLYSSFEDRIEAVEHLSDEQKKRFLSLNEKAVRDCVIPSYQKLIQSLEALKATGKNSIGLCGLPDGTSYYEYLVKCETGSDRSIPELETFIYNQIREDLVCMQEILESSKYAVSSDNTDDHDIGNTDEKNGDLTGVQTSEPHTTTFTLPDSDPEAILSSLRSNLDGLYPSGPDVQVEIKYVQPEMEEYLSPAFYMIPAIDNTLQNTIYINSGHLPDDLELFTTLAHEAYPGHLYQNTYYASTDPSPIRSILDCGGYTEGWAVYAEMTSYYFAETDQAALLQRNASVILGLYALADIGIHYNGWTLIDTVSFFRDFGITDNATIRQIYELIIGDPANYLKYYVGYAEFLQLKRDCTTEWDSKFTQERFHKAVLDVGPMPFYLLRKIVLK